MEAIETEEYNGHTIEIVYDSDPQDPRTDWEPFTEFHVKNCRYYLGEHQHNSSEEIDDEVKKAKRQGDVVFRLFAYIHSGTALSLESFYGRLPQGHAEFDSGQCGVVIVRRKSLIENFGKKRMTKKLRERAYEIAKGEVEEFTQYLNGQVYGYRVDDGEGDSCYGYYSTEDAMTEAKSAVDYAVAQAKAEAEKLQPSLPFPE